MTKMNNITDITFQNTERNFNSVVVKLGLEKTGIGLEFKLDLQHFATTVDSTRTEKNLYF